MTYAEVLTEYEPVIGIETHVQLATRSKLFCGCDNDAREARPNTQICAVCLGLPGTLPVLNEQAILLAIRMGLGLGSQIATRTKFDRKNYFYPDLPKGYQITQFDQPIVGPGQISVPVGSELVKVGITRAHLEEDAGKLIHPPGQDYSLVDLNRAGTPLLEIVSEPDMHTPAEAKAYAQELHLIARYARVSDANLYYGNMRFDVNVSLRRVGTKSLGTRAEVKNLNSFRSVERAVEYEVVRQAEILRSGGEVRQETRGFNEDTGTTTSQRSKEEADEYRYFPEPDVPPLVVSKVMLESAAQASPADRLPGPIRQLMAKSGVELPIVETLVSEPELAYLFLGTLTGGNRGHHRRIANWLTGEVKGQLQAEPTGPLTHLTPHRLIKLAEMVEEGSLSSTTAKEVLLEVIQTGKEPTVVAKQRNLSQVSDTAELEKVITTIIAANSQAAADYRAGNERALGALVGAAMKETRGQGNPQILTQLIKQHLG